MSSASQVIASEDRTVYPVEERVGEDIIQRLIVELLRPLIARWLEPGSPGHQGQPCFVGADQFIYYEQYNPLERVAPDVYVLPGVPPDTAVTSWKVWETGIAPSLALEVVSQDWKKDYSEAPGRYQVMGVGELLVFDPYYAERRDGMRWQRFGRDPSGRLQRVEHTDADRVRSSALGCWLKAVGVGPQLKLRLALDPQGDTLFPTAEEAERQAKEAERQAKEAALARVAELEAALRRKT